MQKCEDQVMNAWFSDVKHAAFHLKSSGVAIIDKNVILALTARLLESYSTFIITLNHCYNFEQLSDNCLYLCSVLGKLSIVYSCLLGSRFNLSSSRVPLTSGIV